MYQIKYYQRGVGVKILNITINATFKIDRSCIKCLIKAAIFEVALLKISIKEMQGFPRLKSASSRNISYRENGGLINII